MSWAFPAAARVALAEIIAARRDVRRFRPDPVGGDIIDELLAAGHAAPSVGHSQPWRFVVVTDRQLRVNAAVMADRARLAQAQQLDADSARHLRSLQLEGIREAPVGIVVCCDRRARPAGVLGRATFPDADLWSCACAIENIWLTARAHGLGLGWVTLFDPEELNALLSLPEGVVTLGWLCLGWPDELPPAPGLERQGWSRRLDIADVVARDQWPDANAAPPPRDRAAETAGAARVAARDREDRLLAAPGSLGLLGDTLLRVESVTARDAPGTLVIAAADHPVAGLGVSAFPRSTTRLVARALAEGEGQGAAMARAAGLKVFLADCGIDGTSVGGWRDLRPRGARGDLASADALESGAVAWLLAAGERLGRELAAGGPVALGEVGIGNTTVASALAAALLAVPAQQVVGRGAGSDTAIVARKQLIVEQALARMGDRTPPPGQLTVTRVEDLLAGMGGPEQALLTGVCLGVAQAGGIVVLDGFLTSVSALVAVRHRPEVQAHLVAGHVSAEPAHRLVLDALGLEPLLDLRLRAGEGVGAVLALSLITQTQRARQMMAATD
jgi:nicotinate-nucleotide--dimethylbenzimidazole phosphoribosyltransferase